MEGVLGGARGMVNRRVGLSTRDKLRMGPLSLIQWSLSARDKLGMEPLYKGQVVLSTGTSWGRSLGELTVLALMIPSTRASAK